MIELPLAERELARRGKQKWTYGLRSVVAGVSACVVLVAGGMGAGSSPEQVLDYLGGFMTSLSSLFQFSVVFLLAPMLAAETIVREKENRTLALLLMADLRGTDIYVAKFLSVFLWAELLMLSALPLLAFASIFGGVTVPAVVLQLFLLSVALAAVCVMGIFCSTVTRTFTESLLLTAALEGFWLWGLYQLDRFLAAQGLPLKTSFIWVTALGGPRTSFAGSLPTILFTVVAFGVLARLTVLLLPRQAYEPTVRRRIRRSWRILPLNPAAKLVSETATGLGARLQSRPMRFVAAIGLAVVACIPVYGVLVILFVMTYDITSSLKGVQKGGVLDDLWITPLSNRALARAMFRAYFDRSLLYWPAFVSGQVAFLHASTAGLRAMWSPASGAPNVASVLPGALILLILLALMQVCCVVGLSCRSAATPIRYALGQAVAVVLYFLTYTFFGAMNAFAGTGALMWLLSKTPIPAGHPLVPMALFCLCALFLYGLAASLAYVWFVRDFDKLAGEGRPAPEKTFRDRSPAMGDVEWKMLKEK